VLAFSVVDAVNELVGNIKQVTVQRFSNKSPQRNSNGPSHSSSRFNIKFHHKLLLGITPLPELTEWPSRRFAASSSARY
jgi:hypothetical protein